ncbi:hypothetical protein Nepgr_002924 [Nepenthes gracilis]|uniref:Uncharacterized protein n=1 Tax=Nepenthes gracilis TaxID=150966 RepID=A0AAD3RYL6_NEPGR|nr:hypothetical protein Nepgr_002924 [Nepenthes gracilis]
MRDPLKHPRTSTSKQGSRLPLRRPEFQLKSTTWANASTLTASTRKACVASRVRDASFAYSSRARKTSLAD